MSHGSSAGRREEAGTLLATLVSACPAVVEPHAPAILQARGTARTAAHAPAGTSRAVPLMSRAPLSLSVCVQVLMPQLHDTDAGVAACALSAFGELAKAALPRPAAPPENTGPRPRRLAPPPPLSPR